ncbi:MAG: hypothetical protein AB1668_00810 [Nanoarchaeota archaeon]
MLWKRFLFLSLLAVFAFSFLSLAESTINVTAIDNEITTAEEAKFSVTITNNRGVPQEYSIYSLQSGEGWDVAPSPLADKIVKLGAGKSYTTTIVARLPEKNKEKFPPGIYFVHLTVQSDQGESYTEALKIYLRSEGIVDYLPAIKATVDMDEKINPQNPLSIKLFLENKNKLNLKDLKIKIQSDMPEFVKEVVVELQPLEKKTVEFAVDPNDFQQPGDYVLFFVFERAGETVKIIEKRVEIVSMMSGFTMEVSEEEQFLKTLRTLTIKNGGNVRNTQTVKLPVTFLESLFTNGGADVQSEEGKKYLAWEMTLNPDETTIITAVTNYRIPLYALIVVLLFAGFYFLVQSPLSIRKTAVTVSSGEGGALSEIKVTLEVVNRSKKPVKEISVIDVIPGIANMEKNLDVGTLKPREVKHSKIGTKVFWSLAELDAHEQRLITYNIRAKLNILGTFSLPRAAVEFKKKSGRKGKAYSNVFRISG